MMRMGQLFSGHPPMKKDSRLRLVNRTRGSQIAASIEVADSGAKRSKGLLGRSGLEPGTGIWILPCEAVHTFFMRFAIDLIYLDRDYRIRKLCSDVRPWRLSGCLRAHSVVELPAGALRSSEVQVGDFVDFLSLDPTEEISSEPDSGKVAM